MGLLQKLLGKGKIVPKFICSECKGVDLFGFITRQPYYLQCNNLSLVVNENWFVVSEQSGKSQGIFFLLVNDNRNSMS